MNLIKISNLYYLFIMYIAFLKITNFNTFFKDAVTTHFSIIKVLILTQNDTIIEQKGCSSYDVRIYELGGHTCQE